MMRKINSYINILTVSTRPHLFIRPFLLLNFIKVSWVCEIHCSEILYSICIEDGKNSQLALFKV